MSRRPIVLCVLSVRTATARKGLNIEMAGQAIRRPTEDSQTHTSREPASYRQRKDGRAGTLDANYYKGLANQERPGVVQPFLDPDNDIGYNGSQDGDAKKTRPNQILPDLQQVDSQTTLQQRRVDELASLQQDEILQPRVHEKGLYREVQNRQPEMDDSPLSSKANIQAISQEHVRDMQQANPNRNTPQERGLAGQPSRKPTGTVSRMSHETTPDPSSKELLQETLKEQLGSVRIRRLTPLETERLQGFPDNWTAEGIDGPISDTQRYKMCGNAVTTNVVQAVFERIFELAMEVEV